MGCEIEARLLIYAAAVLCVNHNRHDDLF
jgi:hypothetical protein